MQDEFVVSVQKPPHAALYMMPCAAATIQEGAFCSLLMQEIRREEFCITLHIFQAHELPAFRLSVEKPCAALIYVLQGEATYSLPGIGRIVIEEGYYYLLYFPTGTHSLQLETNICMIVQIELTPSLLNKLAGTYYGMYEAHNNVTENGTGGILLNISWMNPRVCDTLSKLIYCRLEEEMGALYQETRMRDLLLLYAEDVADRDKREHGNFNFSSADINAILEAGNQQIQKIDETVYLKDVARNAHLHPLKFHAGFKKVYGKSHSKMLAEARIEKAKSLLKETDKSVKDIAYETGFCNASSLIRFFKRHEGITPLQYRK
ncbi:AraC family transcriptional regulator [Chitinophaga sp. SYP-B3965]|uniref:helix-turn-helix domain-containing protein n=1 Tax=Chitinophaga sp. SYP-B3965 TaxID=2663120 RepID=UPI001564074D|nr:helix-turn-helix transcriptional regulator [Chitinophaga sp. SYP-B3965]